MKNLTQFNHPIEILFTDIDDTLTDEGRLEPAAYSALWSLHESGIKVIPVTGRPAGWCEMIARQWPVDAVVGENGGFYFLYKNRKMIRRFMVEEDLQTKNRALLVKIQNEVKSKIPGAGIASDQFCRLMDLAVDFCEDVPHLPEEKVAEIVHIFNSHGAQAKVSSIHVNGWFGSYNKVTTALTLLADQFGMNKDTALKCAAFVGDSPNDEPMFEIFPHSFAVANFLPFSTKVKYQPQYISNKNGGHGFAQIAERLIAIKGK
jgi:HAD superfamily hydrolase (TIGR01484 family)